MTVGKKHKKRVRARMEADGVSYSEALRRVNAERSDLPQSDAYGSLVGHRWGKAGYCGCESCRTRKAAERRA